MPPGKGAKSAFVRPGGPPLANAGENNNLPAEPPLHFYESRCLELCLWAVLWLPPTGEMLLEMVKMLPNAQDWTDMDEGWLYGEWETGPWWAFHTKVYPF